MDLFKFLEVFGEAGLVVTIMGLVIFFLGKYYMKERSAKDDIQKEYNDYIKDSQSKQIETITIVTNLLDATKETLTRIETKIDTK